MGGPEEMNIPDTIEELEAMLLDGLKSGPGIVMDDTEWRRLSEKINDCVLT